MTMWPHATGSDRWNDRVPFSQCLRAGLPGHAAVRCTKDDSGQTGILIPETLLGRRVGLAPIRADLQ